MTNWPNVMTASFRLHILMISLLLWIGIVGKKARLCELEQCGPARPRA